MAAPDLNDVRKVALSLPPNERINGAEVADVLSGFLALARYGKPLLDATNEGTVTDFFHDLIVKDAKERGIKNPDGTDFVPQRGARPTPVVPGAPVPGSVGADVAQLSKQVASLTELVTNLVTGLQGAHAPADVPDGVSSGETVTPDAPSTAPAPPATTKDDEPAEHVPASDDVFGGGLL